MCYYCLFSFGAAPFAFYGNGFAFSPNTKVIVTPQYAACLLLQSLFFLIVR